MNRIGMPLLGLLFISFAACNNGDKKNNNKTAAETLKATADSLYKEVIKGHNEGMNGWMKIEGRQKEIKTILDSIAKLPSKAHPSLDALKAKLNEAAVELGDAYKQMDDWMSEMDLDSAVNNLELRIQYLTGEKMKGSKIKDLISSSLQKADSLVKARL